VVSTASRQPVPVSSFVALCGPGGHGIGRTLAATASKRRSAGSDAASWSSIGAATPAGSTTTTTTNRLGRPTSPPDPWTG
jgi:hypothetical protein